MLAWIAIESVVKWDRKRRGLPHKNLPPVAEWLGEHGLKPDAYEDLKTKRTNVAHEGLMNVVDDGRDFPSDLRDIGQLRTLVTAVIAKLIGYEGPLTKHDVDEDATRKLGRRLFRDLDSVEDSAEYQRVHSEYLAASRGLEEPEYWIPRDSPPEEDSRHFAPRSN